MEKVIKIKGMSCSHCIKAVSDKLNSLSGVTLLDINLKEARVESTIDDKIIVEAIKSIGFKAKI